MKVTKKQIGITATIVLVLAGGGVTVGVVNHNNTVQAKQVQEQKAREAKIKVEKAVEATAIKAIETAEKNPTDQNLKAADEAVAKVTNEKTKEGLLNNIGAIRARVKLENMAKSAVSTFQSDNGNAKKQENAQTAVNNLSSESKSLKTDLQNKINASVKAREAAVAKAKADQAAQDKKETDAQTQATQQVQKDNTAQISEPQVTQGSQVPAQDNNTYYSQSQAATGQASAPNYTAPAAQTPAQSNPSNKGGGNAPAGWQSGTDADSLAKQEEAAQNAGTGNANNKQPGAKW